MTPTESAATSVPTLQPITYQPTIAPTSVPTAFPSLNPTSLPTFFTLNGERYGALRIDIRPDDNFLEVHLIVTEITISEVDGTEQRTVVGDFPIQSRGTSYFIKDLDWRAEFEVRITDAGGNGICCDSGEGFAKVHEIHNGDSTMLREAVLETDGQFGALWAPERFTLAGQ